jgi:hypothetical protein
MVETRSVLMVASNPVAVDQYTVLKEDVTKAWDNGCPLIVLMKRACVDTEEP